MDSGMWDPKEARLGVVIDYGEPDIPSDIVITENQRIYAVLWADGTTGMMRRWMIRKAIKCT